MAAPMSAPSCVIGVDLGGTKLLAGVVGPDLSVRHRIRRPSLGLDQAALMSAIADAVGELREAEEVAAVGFGIPVTLDQRTRTAVYSTHLPLAGVPFASVMSERLGIPVVVDNDGNCAVLAEARFGAGGGLGRRGHAHARHRDRRRARAGRAVAARLDRRGRRARAHGRSTWTARPARARARTAAASR